MKIYSRLLLALGCWALPLMALSQVTGEDVIFSALGGRSLGGVSTGLFTPPLTDKSILLLQQLFGSVGTVLQGTGSQLLGQMFAIFNLGIWVIAGAFVGYTTVISIVNTAKDGQFLGRSQVSGWVAVRTAGGIAMLLPKFTGYSFVQVMVMWIVVQGVGLADHIWGVSIDYLKGGGVIYSLPAVQGEGAFAGSGDSSGNAAQTIPPEEEGRISLNIINDASLILKSEMCMIALEIWDEQNSSLDAQNNTQNQLDRIYKSDSYDANGNLIPGSVNFGDSDNPSVCGSYSWHNYAPNAIAQADSIYGPYKEIAIRQVATDLFPVAESIIKNKMPVPPEKCLYCLSNSDSTSGENSNAYCSVQAINDGKYCSPAYQIFSAAVDYESIMEAARVAYQREVNNANNEDSNPLPNSEMMKQDGWITAGMQYFALTDPKLVSKEASLQDFMDTNETNFRFVIDDNTKPDARTTSSSVTLSPALNAIFTDQTSGSMAARLKQGFQWLGLPTDPVNFTDDTFQTESQSFLGTSSGSSVTTGGIPRSQASFIKQAYAIYLSYSALRSGSSSDITIRTSKEREDVKRRGGRKVEYGGSGLVDRGITETVSLKDKLEEMMKVLTAEGLKKNRSGDDSKDFRLFFRVNYDVNKMMTTALNKWIEINFPDTLSDRAEYANPIVRLRELGYGLLTNSVVFWHDVTKDTFDTLRIEAERIFLGLSGTGFLLAATAGARAQPLMTGITAGSQLIFQIKAAKAFWILPLGVAVSAPLFMMGIVMGIYTPLIPYIVFTFSSIGWLISVVEAMAAAPLVALGVTHPEGHDLMGKAEQSMMLLLSIFLRPAAILLGFIVGIVLSFVALNLLDSGFLNVMASQIQGFINSDMLNTQTEVDIYNVLILAAGFMIIYVFLVTAVVNQAFSLVYRVPANLTSWLGAPKEPSDVPQAMAEVKGGLEQQADKGSRGGGEMATAQSRAISPPQGPQVKGKDDEASKIKGSK